MVEYDKDDVLSGILKAVSDPTRRRLLVQVCQEGPSRVTDLAAGYAMSLNAISKHIKVLEQAGLVRRSTVGRIHWIEADLDRVRLIEQWVSELKSVWEMRLDKLNEIITNGEKEHE